VAKKQQHRIRNWAEYNKALVKRGSLTVWFDKNTIAAWKHKPIVKKRGRPTLYSDLAIEFCLTIKALFKLPLRAAQGFVTSIFQLMKLSLPVPDYTSLCKRQKTLKITLPAQKQQAQKMHIVVDSTGLKVFGEGEWKVRKHGKEKRRTWLKLHLALDESTHYIKAAVLTGDNVHDCEMLPNLLNQMVDDIGQITGDGAYDTHDAYQAVLDKGGTPCFPPRKNAIRHKATDEAWRLRNHAVSQVGYHNLKYWKKKSNYHRRSLAETAMYRVKQLMGDRVCAKTVDRQSREVGIKCLILNKMTELGMPVYAA
jgi:IS5 family transposase